MQKQVHEESNLVAKQHIGAVEGAAGTCQVVGVCSSTEGSNRQMKKIINQLWKKKKKKKKKKTPPEMCLTLLQKVKEKINQEKKRLTIGTDKTICSHQETKHTPLYLWFLKGAVCLCKSKAYLTDSASKEDDLRNKNTHISYLCGDSPFCSHLRRSLSAISVPSWLRWCSISAGEIKLLLSAAPRGRQAAPGSGQCRASQHASVLCLL